MGVERQLLETVERCWRFVAKPTPPSPKLTHFFALATSLYSHEVQLTKIRKTVTVAQVRQ